MLFYANYANGFLGIIKNVAYLCDGVVLRNWINRLMDYKANNMTFSVLNALYKDTKTGLY